MSSEPNDGCESLQEHKKNLRELKRRASITRDVRFRSGRRLQTRSLFSYFVIAGHSLLIIILSLLPNVYIFSPAGGQVLLALSIVNSFFVIITTFWEASGDFSHQAQQYHKSAIEIGILCTRLSQLNRDSLDEKCITDLANKFQKSLDKYPFIHSEIDYDAVLFINDIEKGKFRHQRFKFWIIRITYWIRPWLWLTPHLIVLLATLIMVYLIIVVDFFGKTELIGSYL